ncbi:MAG: hypothetical protein ABIA04_16275 [Pseudomonadota bacterium]
MKIISVSGSYSQIGKTTLARKIRKFLSDDFKVYVFKIGHGRDNPNKEEKLFIDLEKGVSYIKELEEKKNYDFLIVESNSVLNHIKPDLALFLMGNKKGQKKTSELAFKKADIIIDNNFNTDASSKIIKEKLNCDSFGEILLEQSNYINKND